jgi:hypothetical protein
VVGQILLDLTQLDCPSSERNTDWRRNGIQQVAGITGQLLSLSLGAVIADVEAHALTCRVLIRPHKLIVERREMVFAGRVNCA